jgi:signal transduction histidine kinase
MAERSAAVLTEAMLCDDTAEAIAAISSQLAADPPLLLWAICRARGELTGPKSLREVALWLEPRAVDVLQWEPDSAEPDVPTTPKRGQYADQVAVSLQVADLASRLAQPQDQTAGEQAQLLGLLHNARQWLTLAASDESSWATDCLPDWLARLDDHPAAPWIAEALEVLAGDRPAPSLDLSPSACRQRALEGRQRWLEAVAGPGSRLPALMARLGRLARLEDQFQETLETEKLAAMAEFAAGAGHEINNPLAIIGGRAQLFLREETDPERRRELALINAQVKRAYEMIADMRLFARPPRPELASVELAGLVDAVIADLAPQGAEQGITIERTGDPGPMEIEADPAQLNMALRAMCRNSLEAIGQNGRIEIALSRHAHEVQIRVSDNGPGIPPDVRRHIFDPYYSSRQAGRGLGLGLSKCWRIVILHGGRLTVHSKPGHGATFTITLPPYQADLPHGQ